VRFVALQALLEGGVLRVAFGAAQLGVLAGIVFELFSLLVVAGDTDRIDLDSGSGETDLQGRVGVVTFGTVGNLPAALIMGFFSWIMTPGTAGNGIFALWGVFGVTLQAGDLGLVRGSPGGDILNLGRVTFHTVAVEQLVGGRFDFRGPGGSGGQDQGRCRDQY
jgi:hypothetical protein